MALEDPCPEARAAAWFALAGLFIPDRETLALSRLSTEPPPASIEKEALAFALGTVGSEAFRGMLRALAADPDPNVVTHAQKALEMMPAEILPPLGAANPGARRKVLRQLERAVKTADLEAQPDAEQFLAALTPNDLPLVNRARASVLRRLSDECLYDWYPLTRVARVLRARAHRQARGP